MTTEQLMPDFLVFASRITEISEGMDYNAIFTGLSISIAAALIDISITADGKLDEDTLTESFNTFGGQVAKAIDFAKSQIQANLAANDGKLVVPAA